MSVTKVEESQEVKETKKNKSQFVDILVSYYSYKDKIVSVVGIQNDTTVVSHIIKKKEISPDGWFKILQSIAVSLDFTDGQKKDLERFILDESKEFVIFPPRPARSVKPLGELVHKIETVKVEF